VLSHSYCTDFSQYQVLIRLEKARNYCTWCRPKMGRQVVVMLIGHTAISGDHHNRRVANGAVLAVRSGLTSTEVQPTGRGPYIPPVFCGPVPESLRSFVLG
jgi:hypothetical protein